MVKSEFRGCWGRGERLSSAIEKVRRGSGREKGWWGCHLNYRLTGGAGGMEPKVRQIKQKENTDRFEGRSGAREPERSRKEDPLGYQGDPIKYSQLSFPIGAN
jgi:hypothetical protein